jgi:5-bromo-4-chloroindolyl phosphate hydrolysis protein
MLPWIKILSTGASVVEIARDIYVTVKRSNKALPDSNQLTLSDLQTKVKLLEENEERQAALMTKMAEQQKNIAERLFFLYFISISSLIAAIFSIAFHFWN